MAKYFTSWHSCCKYVSESLIDLLPKKNSFMKIKNFTLCIAILFITTAVFSQDSSHVVQRKFSHSKHMMTNGSADTPIVTKRAARGKSHTMININSGTSIPNTTSGTLSSGENPSTQFAIPLRKRNKKSNANVAPAPLPNPPVKK